MQPTLSIDMVSDFACPWCYIGEWRLRQAIAERPYLDVQWHWLPFQLNPDMHRQGRNRREYYRDKFGAEGASNLRCTSSGY